MSAPNQTTTNELIQESAYDRLRAAAQRKIAAFVPSERQKPIEVVEEIKTETDKEDETSKQSPYTGPGPGRPPKPIASDPVKLPAYPCLINADESPETAIDDLLAYLGAVPASIIGTWLTDYHRQILRLSLNDLLDKLGNPTVQEIADLTGQNYHNIYMVLKGKSVVGLDRLNSILGKLGYGVKPVIVPLGVIAHDRVMAELGMLDYKGEVK